MRPTIAGLFWASYAVVGAALSAWFVGSSVSAEEPMIIRLIVIDPKPRDPRDDVIVYQVPSKSRAHELLLEMLEKEGLECVEVEPRLSKRKVKSAQACVLCGGQHTGLCTMN